MDFKKIEEQFKQKLRSVYDQHKSLQDQFDADEFCTMFSIKYKNGLPQQPLEPEGKKLDPTTYQLVLAAFNDVYP